MSDLNYLVSVDFASHGNMHAPLASLDKLQSSTDKWGKSLFGHVEGFAGKFNSAIDSIASSAIGASVDIAAGLAAGLSAGLFAATKVAFDFNDELEQTTTSLAAIANANGTVESFGSGLRVAADVFRDMRQDAAKLPGELKDLENIMATVMSPLSQMGVGMFGAESIASKIMSAAAVLKVPMNVAGREMAMMLEGNARHSMPMFNRMNLGMGTKEFNALAPEKRLAVLRDSLERLSPAMKHFEGSWNAIKTTAVDNLRYSVAGIGGPLFQSIKQSVVAFNDWSSNNQDELSKWGEILGNGIDSAFHRGVEGVKHWFPIVKDFSVSLYEHLHTGWQRFEPMVDRLLGRVEGFMKDPGAFGKLESAARTLVALRAGGAMFEGGMGLMPSFGSMSGAASLMGGSAGLIPLLEAAPFAAAALVTLSASVYGAVDVLTDTSNQWHNFAVGELAVIGATTADVGTELVKLKTELKPLTDILGVTLLASLGRVSTELDLMTKSVRMTTEGFSSALGFMFPWARQKLNPTPYEPTRPPWLDTFPIKQMDAPAEREFDRKIPQNVTHIHGGIHINVAPNSDPNRVAKRTKELLMEEVSRPRTALNSGNPNLTRR